MFHIGGDVAVKKKDIVAILKYSENMSDITKEFINISDDDGFVIYLCPKEKGRSFVLTTNKIYVSPISPLTLKKRGEDFNFL